MTPVDDPSAIRLSLLVGAVHEVTEQLPTSRSAVALYDSASRHAEHTTALQPAVRIPLAATLALAAERRRVTGLGGVLGESRAMLALALAVLDLP
jgi:hypothetical protein